MKKAQTWFAVILVGVGLVASVVLGIFAYMSLTATPIHPSAQEVSSIPVSAPARRWAVAG